MMENHHHQREREESISQESPQEEERFIREEEEEESPDEMRDGKGKSRRRRRRKREFPSTLWEYLKEEVRSLFSQAFSKLIFVDYEGSDELVEGFHESVGLYGRD